MDAFVRDEKKMEVFKLCEICADDLTLNEEAIEDKPIKREESSICKDEPMIDTINTGSIVATVVFGPRALTDPDTPDQRKTEGARNHATLSGYAAPVRSGRQGSLLTLDTLSSRNAGGCLGGLEETLRYLGQQSSGNSNINTSSKGRGGVGLQAGSSFLGMRDQKPSV